MAVTWSTKNLGFKSSFLLQDPELLPSGTESKTRAVQLRYLTAISPGGGDFDPAIAVDQAIAISAIAPGEFQSSGGN